MKLVGKIFKAIGITLLVLVVLVLACVWFMFGSKIKAANSIKKLDDKLYFIEYKGDYGFDGFIEEGGSSTDAGIGDYMIRFLSHGYYSEISYAQPETVFACTGFKVTDDAGEVLVGRNFDWNSNSDKMIVHTKPKAGYESYSTCCMEFLGFGNRFVPDESMMTRMESLATIYVPQDGINEKGLVVIDLIDIDGEIAAQATEKVDLTTCTAIRYLLDKAADVDEALALLEGIDMNSSIGVSHHLFLADANGKSGVVEYIDNKLVFTASDLVTNFDVSKNDRTAAGTEEAFARFDRVKDAMNQAKNMEAEEVYGILSTIAHYDDTRWSIVYNLSRPGFEFHSGNGGEGFSYKF